MNETTFSVSSADLGGQPNAIVISGDAIFIAGSTSAGGSGAWRIEKRSRLTGALDSAFGSGGVVASDPNPGQNDELNDMILVGGSLCAIGIGRPTGLARWRIEKRSAATGALDSGFGAGGTVIQDPAPAEDDFLYSVVPDSSATAMYLAGSSDVGAGFQQWRIEKRALATGVLDPSFNGTGVVTIAAGGGTQSRIYDMARDGTALYVAGGFRAANVLWRASKLSLVDGSPMTAFDGDGHVDVNPSPALDEAKRIALDSSGVYFTGSLSALGRPLRLEKRDLNTGAAVAAFDGDGSLILDPNVSGDDLYESLIVDASQLILTGWDSDTGGTEQQWRISMRDPESAALISTFGSGGVLQLNPTTGNDRSTAAAVDAAFIYFAGFTNATSDAWRLDKRTRSTGAL